MSRLAAWQFTLLLALGCGAIFACAQPPSTCAGPPPAPGAASAATPVIDLARELTAGRLHAGPRAVTPVSGAPGAVRLGEGAGEGIAWIEGTDLANGTIEVAVCGRDVYQQSFLGVAFHRQNDTMYEGVYLRPFNFRADDAARRHHAVQYIAIPDYDWPKLRQDFPEKYEAAVDASVSPAGWIPLRVVLNGTQVEAYAGSGAAAALSVQKLGTTARGQVGLWVGNGSDGVFANLRVTPR